MGIFRPEETKFRRIEPNLHLKISLSIIYYMGTWPPRGKYRSFYIVYTIFGFVFMLGIFLTTELANFALSWGNMTKMIAGATLLMTNCTHAWKVIVILSRQRRIQALLDIARSETFSRYNEKYASTLSRYTWRGILHHIAYQSFGAAAVLSWGFTPIADLIAGRTRQLPIEGWYPYNVTVTPAFEITSSHQGIAIIIACFHNVAMDTLVTGLVRVACCQFTLLSKNVASIENVMQKDRVTSRNDSHTHKTGARNDDRAYEELKVCIEHNNKILDFAREIQDIFGFVIFLQFLVNCIIICLIAFNISQMNVFVPSVFIGMFMYMCCMTYQIFIYCWHGNELHLHSTRLHLAAYSCNWWQGSDRFKKGIQIIMSRTQRPLVLSAGNIMLLSLHTFVRILRMSYSIFTVLQSTTTV